MDITAKTEDFYNWFKDMGGNLVTYHPEILNNNIRQIPLETGSTLKANAQRIKQTYNHKFKKNEY